MTWLQKVAANASRFLHWLGTPFRVIGNASMWLVDLTPRQMQSLCTISMIGGIVANSFWTYVYIIKVEKAVLLGVPSDSPLFELILSVVKYLAIMSGGFALFMCLIAFGAEWIRVKYKGLEAGAGRDAKDAAREVADAADDAADKIEEMPTEPAEAGEEIN